MQLMRVHTTAAWSHGHTCALTATYLQVFLALLALDFLYWISILVAQARMSIMTDGY
jgi:hypothetical protein